MIDLKQRKRRNFEPFKSVSDVIDILKGHFQTRTLNIKYSTEKSEMSINEYFDDNTLMVITDPDYQTEGDLIIFGLYDKYIEVDMEILDKRGPGYFHCKIKSARRASAGRRDLRFKVALDEVYATNFRVSKQSIDLGTYNVPTSIKVVLDQFHHKNVRMGDIVKADVFDSSSTDPVLNSIRKSGKTFFISDTRDPESYKPFTEDFADPEEIYENKIKAFINRNIERGYKSIIIVPIIYIADNESSIPFGYIQLISKSENFGIEKVLEVKEHTFNLVDRIRDANTKFINKQQELIDISRGGAKLKISDADLKASILKSKGFIFDLVFKLQAPITIYGEVKVTYTDDHGNLFVGMDFEGNSSRKDEMKRFYSIIKPMEEQYKSKLMKSIKKKKRNE